MRVCFLVVELFHWGRYGGFGALTRTIGNELVKRNIEVYVITPRQSLDQRPTETLDGMTVLAIPTKSHHFSLSACLRSRSLIKLCDADIYHSEEASVATYFAKLFESKKKHIVTLQDPFYVDELRKFQRIMKNNNSIINHLGFARYRLEQMFINRSLNQVNAIFSQAKYIIPKILHKFTMKTPVAFLPNPVKIPEKHLKKADEPTFCFIARWDKVKRVELFFELAKEFPEATFIATGKSHDQEQDRNLRKLAGTIKNVYTPGFVNENKKKEILEKSWIYINTSIRECLPVAFLEAAAHQCAIVSYQNPDWFAEKFGYHVKNDTIKDYVAGIRFLLKNDLWKDKGKKGYDYVKEVHELNKVINQHIAIYEKVLSE